MGVTSVLNRNCKQTAVYWGTPVDDGYGGFTFAEPVEIKVRWEEKSEVFTDDKGQEKLSLALVYSLQDVDKNGYIYLGELADFDSTVDEDAPETIEGAYPISRLDKSPSLGSISEFVRKIYLEANAR